MLRFKTDFPRLAETTRRSKYGGTYATKVPSVRRPYVPNLTISREGYEKVLRFAHAMTFGKEGFHRDHRTGGTLHRKPSETFCNAVIGKIAEQAIYETLTALGIECSEPDWSISGRGKWDSGDLTIFFLGAWRAVSVKASKSTSNLHMLECPDWEPNVARYVVGTACGDPTEILRLGVGSDGMFRCATIPMEAKKAYGIYDMHLMARIERAFCDALEATPCMRNGSPMLDVLLSETLPLYEKLTCEVGGVLFQEELRRIMLGGYVIRRGERLGSCRMDADNYYALLAGTHSFEETFVANVQVNRIRTA